MVDAWSREPVAQEFPYRADNGLTRLVDIIKAQSNQMRELTSNLLTTAGLRVLPGKIASKDFDGTDRTHLGTAGWMLGSDGPGLPSYMGLNGRDIFTDIATLIDQVLMAGSIYGSAENFPLTTTEATKASVTVTVPAGFTKAAISVTGSVYAVNPNTTGPGSPPGQDYLLARPTIAGQHGYALPIIVLPANSSGLHVSSFATVLTGLTPGSTFPVTVTATSGWANWAANAVNVAEISGSVLWIR